LNLDYELVGYRNPADYILQQHARINDHWSDSLLPQLGVVYSLSNTEQLFASYSENLALPRGADDVFAGPENPQALQSLDAETARNFEIGFRTNHATFNAALAAYHTRYKNFLQSYSVTVPGSGGRTETLYANVGAVEAYGAELSGVWKPRSLGDRVYFNANVTYNVAEFDNDFVTVNPSTGIATTLPISGNRLPDNSEWLLHGGITYEPLPWLIANISARYVGGRFSNYVNTEALGGYTIVNAYVDIGGDNLSFGPLRALKLRFNVDNLGDKDYLGTLTPNTTGTATFRPGPDRTYQLTLTAGF
jgi:iron complex outermembrane receptor protein